MSAGKYRSAGGAAASHRRGFAMALASVAVAWATLATCGCVTVVSFPSDEQTCSQSFTDRGNVRVFVVGHTFSLADADSYEAYEASYRRDMTRIAPCVSTSRHNLVVFPEDAGLLAWFIGRRAHLARNAGSSSDAFNAVYAGYYRQADHYRERFSGISAARGLTLALSDTAWRAMDRTFGGIARRYGVWVITSGNLPISELRVVDSRVSLLRDPDAPVTEPGAYIATGPDVHNCAILYDRNGVRAGRINKVFLTDPEEQTLDLSSGRLDELRTFDLPFGRVGAAISRDAFYAPFSQRMEDLGVELVVQPEAFSGWTIEQHAGDWLPDVMLSAGWSAVQKYQGLRFSAAPMLTGNLFDNVFDGQVFLATHMDPGQPSLGFVGSEATRGWIGIGPWVESDPGLSNPALTLAARRQSLRATGEMLRPGAPGSRTGRYVSSLVAADLELARGGVLHPPVSSTPGTGRPSLEVSPATSGHQANPAVARSADGTIHVAFSQILSGVPQTVVSTSRDGRNWAPGIFVALNGLSQRRAAVAVGPRGVVYVGHQEGAPGHERIRVYRWTPGTTAFEPLGDVDAGAGAQWEPSLAVHPFTSTVTLVWSDFREGLAPRLRFARSMDRGETWSRSEPIEPLVRALPRYQGAQLQSSLSVDVRTAVAWIDYRDREWAVYASIADENGTFGPARRVDPDEASEVLASDPQLSQSPDGSLVIAWDDLRQRRGHHDVRFAYARAGSGAWTQGPLLADGADDGRFVSRFRPSAAFVNGHVRLVFQDTSFGRNTIGIAEVAWPVPEATTRLPVQRLDDTGGASLQLTRPRIAASPDGMNAVVVFENDRSGWVRVHSTQPF